MVPSFGAINVVFAPALSSALRGASSSICSNPSVAKIATRIPSKVRSAIEHLYIEIKNGRDDRARLPSIRQRRTGPKLSPYREYPISATPPTRPGAQAIGRLASTGIPPNTNQEHRFAYALFEGCGRRIRV